MSERIRVLYVDDDVSSLEIRGDILEEEHGFEVFTAVDVESAKETLEERRIDCVLSDLEMPEQDGFDFLEYVRERYSNLPFILFTAHESEEVARKAFAGGATDYFPKSVINISYELLAHRIRQAVAQYRSLMGSGGEAGDAETDVEPLTFREHSTPRSASQTEDGFLWPAGTDDTGGTDDPFRWLGHADGDDLDTGTATTGDDTEPDPGAEPVEPAEATPSDDGDESPLLALVRRATSDNQFDGESLPTGESTSTTVGAASEEASIQEATGDTLAAVRKAIDAGEHPARKEAIVDRNADESFATDASVTERAADSNSSDRGVQERTVVSIEFDEDTGQSVTQKSIVTGASNGTTAAIERDTTEATADARTTSEEHGEAIDDELSNGGDTLLDIVGTALESSPDDGHDHGPHVSRSQAQKRADEPDLRTDIPGDSLEASRSDTPADEVETVVDDVTETIAGSAETVDGRDGRETIADVIVDSAEKDIEPDDLLQLSREELLDLLQKLLHDSDTIEEISDYQPVTDQTDGSTESDRTPSEATAADADVEKPSAESEEYDTDVSTDDPATDRDRSPTSADDRPEQWGSSDSYHRPDGLELNPGSSVLVQCGSQDDRKHTACVDLLGNDDVSDRNVLLIRYRALNERRLETIAAHANRVKIVSIGYTQRVPASIQDSVETVKINNPNDVTRLGIVVTGTVDDWSSSSSETVVCYDPLNVLLRYKTVQSAFRFLHIFLGKLRSADAISHFHVDPSAGDPQEINTLKPLFDDVVTVDSIGVHLENQ